MYMCTTFEMGGEIRHAVSHESQLGRRGGRIIKKRRESTTELPQKQLYPGGKVVQHARSLEPHHRHTVPLKGGRREREDAPEQEVTCLKSDL